MHCPYCKREIVFLDAPHLNRCASTKAEKRNKPKRRVRDVIDRHLGLEIAPQPYVAPAVGQSIGAYKIERND